MNSLSATILHDEHDIWTQDFTSVVATEDTGRGALPNIELDAQWLADDPNAVEVYFEQHPQERGVEPRYAWEEQPEPLHEVMRKIPGISARATAKHSVAPHVEGCADDHEHGWRFAGRRSQTQAVALPAWDYARCVDPLVFKCGMAPLAQSRVFLKPCGSNDASACAPCEQRYRNRLKVIVIERLKVAKPGSTFLFTLTAPGTARHCWAHSYKGKDGKMHASVRCDDTDGRTHDWCPCTTDDTALTDRDRMATWNLRAATRFNRVFWDLKRTVQGFADVAYFRAAEVQVRGVLHFHLVLELMSGLLVLDDAKMIELRHYAVHHGFGCEIDFVRIGESQEDQLKAGRYVAKYVTKTNDGKQSLLATPVMMQHPDVPEKIDAQGTFDPYGFIQSDTRKRFVYRAWSVSRNWGLTMGRVIELQRIYRADGAEAAAALLADFLFSPVRAGSMEPIPSLS